jgi:putative peptidoglycan lipid II flippase
MFASEIDGARSWLNCAFRLMQFPIGVFGVAIATVTLPSVARHHAREDLAAFGHTVEEALRLAFCLTIPAAVGLFVLAPQIIGVIYEHGHFTARDTACTAAALRAYSVGLAGYAAIKILTPCFYALNKPRTPLYVGLLSIALNVGLNLALVKALRWGHVGLAATTGCLALINFAQLLLYLRREVCLGQTKKWIAFLGAVGSAALLCGVAAHFVAGLTAGYVGESFTGRTIALLAGLAAGGGAYVATTLALRVPESVSVFKLISRATRRPPSPG